MGASGLLRAHLTTNGDGQPRDSHRKGVVVHLACRGTPSKEDRWLGPLPGLQVGGAPQGQASRQSSSPPSLPSRTQTIISRPSVPRHSIDPGSKWSFPVRVKGPFASGSPIGRSTTLVRSPDLFRCVRSRRSSPWAIVSGGPRVCSAHRVGKRCQNGRLGDASTGMGGQRSQFRALCRPQQSHLVGLITNWNAGARKCQHRTAWVERAARIPPATTHLRRSTFATPTADPRFV